MPACADWQQYCTPFRLSRLIQEVFNVYDNLFIS